MKTPIKIIGLILILSVPLAACGIKPNSVDAPQGAENDNFPRQYPAK